MIIVIAIIGLAIYGLGYAMAVMRRANSDYKKTKEGLPGMRKAYWQSWWTAVKVGFWVLLAAVILIFWAVHDIRSRTR